MEGGRNGAKDKSWARLVNKGIERICRASRNSMQEQKEARMHGMGR